MITDDFCGCFMDESSEEKLTLTTLTTLTRRCGRRFAVFSFRRSPPTTLTARYSQSYVLRVRMPWNHPAAQDTRRPISVMRPAC
jgi:hypothetical protein